MVNINGKEWGQLTAEDIQIAISEIDIDESFFFEFKSDKESTKKLTKEVSAFSNTFGGYIFIGVTDDKIIENCTEWNEQRIHTTIHDSVTPTPSFDVKRFVCDGKTVYVVRVNEGAEPPYITTQGKIYERLSSGSFPVNDSAKLSQIYSKREQLLHKMELKVSIPPAIENSNNIFGYIDVGLCAVPTDVKTAQDIFFKANLEQIAREMKESMPSSNLCVVGNSIVFSPGGLSSSKGHLPAHTDNMLEIMADGSAKMRVLLVNNNPEDLSVNMVMPITLLKVYKDVYAKIMGDLYPNRIAYVKKYEALTVRKQFEPVVFYDKNVLEVSPELLNDNENMLAALEKSRSIFGAKRIITDNRIPKIGMYTLDKCYFDALGEEFSADSFINELFVSQLAGIGIVPESN